MKSPITGKEMIIVHEKSSVIYRGKTVPYLQSVYLCEDTNTTFTDTHLDNVNMKRMELSYGRMLHTETYNKVKPYAWLLILFLLGIVIGIIW